MRVRPGSEPAPRDLERRLGGGEQLGLGRHATIMSPAPGPGPTN
jgi:hypothetical protein